MVRFDVNEHVSDRSHIVPDLILDRMRNPMADFNREVRGDLNMNIDEVF